MVQDSSAIVRRTAIEDPHSFARPSEVSIRHLQLDLDVDFDARRLAGTAALDLDRHSNATEVVLDTWGLEIEEVRDGSGAPARFELGPDRGCSGARCASRSPPRPQPPWARAADRPGGGALSHQSRGDRAAVARAEADRRRQAALPVHAVAGDPRAHLDPAAGHALGALHLRRHRPGAAGAARADERREPAAAQRHRRLHASACRRRSRPT